ncbi:MAG: ribbon-helix-helix protein, CopG family [Chloroflexi bacterium]|nr:ribbon-helix-helix protein, CopG family [Chloroflexota bacterium]
MAKILVSLNDRLLDRLDREARTRGISRSALIAELAAKGLGEPLGPGARPEARQAIERIRSLFAEREPAEDSTRVIRAMRDEQAERDARFG